MLNNIEALGPNCAAVTPTAPTAGYVPPDIQSSVKHYGPLSTTKIAYDVFNPGELKEAAYQIQFRCTRIPAGARCPPINWLNWKMKR